MSALEVMTDEASTIRPSISNVGDSVVSKVRVIVETVASAGAIGLTDLSRATGITKTTVHRLGNELLDWGVLERRRGKFALGAKMSELGRYAPAERSLADIGRPYAAELFANLRLPVGLSVLHETSMVRCVEKIWAVNQDPAPWMGPGTIAPAYCTAAGKAVVAFSPRAVFDAIVARPLVSRTPYTISGPERLAGELNQIRRTGVAVTHNEIRMGTYALAVPIIDSHGVVHGSLSCGLSPKAGVVDTVVQNMKIQARRIAQQMM